MPAQFVFEAIGTRWQIDIFDLTLPCTPEVLLKIIRDRIEVFDAAYSRFRPDSWVTKIAHSPGAHILPPDAAPMLDLYEQLYRITHGAVTPLIGDTLVAAGYDAAYSLVPRSPRPALAWEDALTYAPPQLVLKKPTLLDFGAIGKGYLIDIVSALLTDAGVRSFCVDAGGDIFYTSPEEREFRVGLEDPNDQSKVIGVARILNNSICGSAGNRRAWGAYHHIMDPFTATSPQHTLAVWVVADSARLADALTTALFLTPAKELAMHFNFSYVLMRANRSIEYSKNFLGELF